MGKVVLFAVLTMDGCLADSSEETRRWLARTRRYGITSMKESARVLNAHTPLTLLSDWVKGSHSVYIMEAETATASIINGMIRMRQFDEIILCTIPVIAGNGCHLFQSRLPESTWICQKVKTYKNGIVKAIYRRNGSERSCISIFSEVFRK